MSRTPSARSTSRPRPTQILSANGNTGDGEIYGINLDASVRYSFFGLPPALITAGVLVQDSTTIDPMGGFERRIVPYDRGNYRLGVRQDLPSMGLSLGLNYRAGFEGNRRIVDIDKIDVVGVPAALNLFVEKARLWRLCVQAGCEQLQRW
jgi:outer membrane receptor for ferrienterochelin and colicins